MVRLACGALILALAACGDDVAPLADAGVTRPLHLVPDEDAVAVRPGETHALGFTLRDDGDRPVEGRVVDFAIIDDPGTPESDAQGATLSAGEAVTDARGRVAVHVMAGLVGVFRVRARSERADDLEIAVVVASGDVASVELVPSQIAAAVDDTTAPIASVRVSFYDDTGCAALSFDSPPRPARPERIIAPRGSLLVGAVATTGRHAALAAGLDSESILRSAGCVDLPGATLLEKEAVRVFIPLRRLPPKIAGSFRAQSDLQFASPPAGITTITDAFNELVLCARDPARLWLDCTIDALGEAPDDPLDCRPSASEGALGDKLLLRRGLLVIADGPDAPASSPGPLRCRSALDSAGRPSLDALAAGLFPGDKPAPVAALPDLAREAAGLFQLLRIRSLITLTPTLAEDRYDADHTLELVTLAVGNTPIGVASLELGLPARTARNITAVLKGTDVQLGAHAFTLRLGSVARVALTTRSLGGRMLPDSLTGFVNALYATAIRAGGVEPLTGCAALDALLCNDAGLPAGCLGTACTQGLAALARNLDRGFTELDGKDLDLVLSGSAFMWDKNGDRVIDQLGRLLPEPARPGVWSGELRTRTGVSGLSGLWASARQ